LDNECSNALKDYMTEQNIDYQLVPPTVHRRNSAERAIRTFKNHFVAGLCSVDRDFPMHLWDKLLPQAELTLNILRGSRLNPKLSAWAQLNGTYDFNRTPIAPPGTRVLVHEKPATRDSWAPHAIDGWYIGPALDSYRCYTVWIQETRAERICDTIYPGKNANPIHRRPHSRQPPQHTLRNHPPSLNQPSLCSCRHTCTRTNSDYQHTFKHRPETR